MAEPAQIQGAVVPSENTDFLKFFCEAWGLTRGELSQLTGKSSAVIDHWFSPGSNREIPPDVADRLRLIHVIWLRWLREFDQRADEERMLGAQVHALFEIASARKRLKDLE